MLGAEFFGRSQDRTCRRTEPFAESAVISRGIIGTFGNSSSNCHWRNSSHANVRPELVRILHSLFPLPRGFKGTTRAGRQLQHHCQYAASAGMLPHFVVCTMRADPCAEQRACLITIMARAGTTCHERPIVSLPSRCATF